MVYKIRDDSKYIGEIPDGGEWMTFGDPRIYARIYEIKDQLWINYVYVGEKKSS